MIEDWDFSTDRIIHLPCGRRANRFLGTHGKIWCTKCSARLPDELEFVSDFMYPRLTLRPLEFYHSISDWLGSNSFYIAMEYPT